MSRINYWSCMKGKTMTYVDKNTDLEINKKPEYNQPYENAHSCSMMTSSNGNIFHVTGHLCREFTGPGEFPAQRPVTRSFDIFFDLHLNKRLSKQSLGWWFETQLLPLWRHSTGISWESCNTFVLCVLVALGTEQFYSYPSSLLDSHLATSIKILMIPVYILWDTLYNFETQWWLWMVK